MGVAPRGRELPDRRQTTRTHADALQTAADDGPGVASSDPLADLTAELTDFQRGVSRRGRISLVGTMLQESTAPDLLKHYRARGIAPRRKRIRPILERAQQLGLIDSDADLEVAVTLCTGSWYARARRFAAPRSLASRYGLSDELAGGPR